MAKNKSDKKVNRIARKLNKQLQDDVFKDRFWVRQVAKQRGDYDGCTYYLYELKDRLEPERDTLISKGWLWGGSNFLMVELFEAMNDFIVKSDFWAGFYNDKSRYSRELDTYKKVIVNEL